MLAHRDSVFLCAPGGIRTPNDGSEDRCDIHFTTGAEPASYVVVRTNTTHEVQ